MNVDRQHSLYRSSTVHDTALNQTQYFAQCDTSAILLDFPHTSTSTALCETLCLIGCCNFHSAVLVWAQNVLCSVLWYSTCVCQSARHSCYPTSIECRDQQRHTTHLTNPLTQPHTSTTSPTPLNPANNNQLTTQHHSSAPHSTHCTPHTNHH